MSLSSCSARHAASNLLEQTPRNLQELGYKAPADARAAVDPLVQELQVCLEEMKEDSDYLKLMDAVDALRFELMKLGLRFYGKQLAPDGAPGPAQPRRPGGVTGGGYVVQDSGAPSLSAVA